MSRDRRRFPRQAMDERRAKVRRAVDGRYLPAETLDLSAGGALMRLLGPARLYPGEAVDLAIASHPGEAIIPADRLSRARVVRTLDEDDTACVAVAFARTQTQTLAAAG